MRATFESLELTINREEETDHPARGPAWTVGIPSWRDDLDRPIDLVEEVLRLHGTEKIPATVVSSPGLVGDDATVVRFDRRVTDYLVGHDFHECVNTTLRSAGEAAAWGGTAADGLALANPFVEDQSHLRPTLIAGLLESLRLNQARGVPVSRLAEIGRIFVEHGGATVECAAAAFLIAEPVDDRSWRQREPSDFYTAKHHVAALAGLAGIDFARQPLTSAASGWQEGHAAAAGNPNAGWLACYGLLDLGRLRQLGIEGKVYGGQFAIIPEKLGAAADRGRFVEFSLFPSALRDIALVVETATPAAEVQKSLAEIARAAAGNTLAVESVTVFDVYLGKGLPEGRKSLAFALVFRSPNRTLTDDEVNQVFQKIQDELTRSTPYQIRR